MHAYYLLPAVGVALGALATHALGRTRTAARVPWFLSLICAWLGLTFWPNPVSLALDGALGSPGLGHLLTDTLITVSFVLQFVFTATVTGRWSGRHWLAVALYSVLVIVYVALWVPIHVSGYDFYHGYSGRPLPVLAINLLLGGLIIYAAALGLSGYASFLDRGVDGSVRLLAHGARIVFSLTILYGVLVLGQTLASRAGLGSTQILQVTGPIIIGTSGGGLFLVWLFSGRRARRLRAYIQERFTLDRERARLEEMDAALAAREARLTAREANAIDLAVWVQGQLCQVHPDIDAAIDADLAARCAARGVPERDTQLALSTARLVALTRVRALRLPRYDLDLLLDDDDDEATDASVLSGSEDQTGIAESSLTFLSDQLWLLALVDPRPLPAGITPRGEPPDRLRVLAALISESLRGQRSAISASGHPVGRRA